MQNSLPRLVTLVTAAALSSLASAQDECTTATPLVLGPNVGFDSTGSTVSSPAISCGFVAATGGDVWYSFTTPAGPAGTLTIDTINSTFDTILELWDSCGGSVIGCNDDIGGGVLQSSVTVLVGGGVTVYARVAGFSTATGIHDVNVAYDSPDECSGATAIFDGLNGPFDNFGATTSAPPSTCSSLNSDLWFVHTASCDGMLTVTTSSAGAGSLSDTVMEAWDGCGGTVLACDDDGGPGLFSEVTIPVLAGTDYIFRVGDFGASVATGLFNVTVVNAPSVGSFNDECACATTVVNGPNVGFDSTGSSVSSPSWGCGFVSGGDVWYSYTATDCGDLTIDTFNSTFDTVLEVFEGSCGNLTSVGCNDDAGGGVQSEVAITGVIAGTTYLIRVGGFSSATGIHDVNITATPVALANDDCAGAVSVAIGANGPFDTRCATTSVEPWPCASGGNDVWFTFTATCDAPHTFRTCGADFDTAIEVLDGSCGSLTSLVCNDDASSGPCSGTRQSSATATLADGTTYYVRVGGFNGAAGQFELEVLTGDGTGSITSTASSACNVAGYDLDFTGTPAIGSSVTATATGGTGIPFIGFGLLGPITLPFPACPCVAITDGNWIFGDTVTLNVPCDTAFAGLPINIQAADLLGSPAACAISGIDSAFTDVYTATFN